MNNLRIALTKGRLEKDVVKILKNVGIDVSELENKGRKLIFRSQNYPIEIVLAKAPDVITYVEHGVVDIGIVGKDTIMENAQDFYEVMDLGVGKCFFAVASLDGYDNKPSHYRKTIASKYPKVTHDYFRQKGEDVDIIKIEGSVELAPILGLADGIVDIVETGNTLRENGLKIYERICDISARVIVNKASMKLKKSEVMNLVEKLQSGI